MKLDRKQDLNALYLHRIDQITLKLLRNKFMYNVLFHKCVALRHMHVIGTTFFGVVSVA